MTPTHPPYTSAHYLLYAGDGTLELPELALA